MAGVVGLAAAAAIPISACAQSPQPSHEPTPIGHTSAKEVQVSGAVSVRGGEMQLGNGSVVTAGDQSVRIGLTRGGQLRLCSTTSVHLSRDRSIDAPDSTALMMALDRGAIEATYTVGKYSDVLLTPDLRILISGPGHADLRVRVNGRGDTCVDNRGANAPYITISSQLEGGLYRVQPNQHVTFEHGSLREVVDTETEPCGCPDTPPPVSVAQAGVSGKVAAQPGQRVAGRASSPDTEFPLAISEGLAPTPADPTAPVAPTGEVHAQVTVPFSYSANSPAGAAAPLPASGNPGGSAPRSTSPVASSSAATPVPAPRAAVVPPPSPSPAIAQAPAAPTAQVSKRGASHSAPGRGFFHKVGHFFSRLFGAESGSRQQANQP